mmetsp:Transcript_1328/g.1661  ORF Transcript_1328/g.1661 Transcript_1328/m.1661 type:complete len:212 (+) Transcript_1328:27-662(+)|eukprot:jgi/Bigna1/88234/estExt_fgenesh1_pg.C_290133
MASGLDDELERETKGLQNREITIIAKGGEKFVISSVYAAVSQVLKAAMLDKECTEIPQKDIQGHIMKMIIDYMNIAKGEDMKELTWPIKYKTMKEICGEGNEKFAEFIDEVAKHRKNFSDLLLATVRLQIKGLQSLGVGKIACLLKWCKSEDLDRILDPAITDGKLLPMRKSVLEERKREEEKRKADREKRLKERKEEDRAKEANPDKKKE